MVALITALAALIGLSTLLALWLVAALTTELPALETLN